MTAPVDRVRIMFQVSNSQPFSFRGAFDTASTIVRETGPQGLWRGNVATLWRVVPFSGIQFLVWDTAHAQFKVQPAFEDRAQLAALLAGACAGVTAAVITYPLDMLRARQACGFNYRNYPAAIEEILVKEGPKGLFKGLAPTVIGMVPYSAISFSTFELLKGELRLWHGVGSDAEVPILQRVIAGGLSGAAAQLAAYPLHIVRRRMQVQPPLEDVGAGGSLSYASTRQALLAIGSTEGFARGLFKSVSLTGLKGPLTVGLAFATNDGLKAFLRTHYARNSGYDQFAPLPGQGLVSTDGEASTPRKLNHIERLVCGGIAGATAKSVIAPGDRVKIMFQTDAKRRFTWKCALDTGRDIYINQGLRGLWRGHTATLLRVAPYSATAFCVFDLYKEKVREACPTLGETSVRFLAGAGAGMTATGMTYPLDMFRARMAAHRGPESPYDGYLRAAIHVVRTEGPTALFSGLRPTLMGIVPYSGITFCLFESFKVRLKVAQQLPEGQDLGSMSRLLCGAVAGLSGQSATYPLDIVRRRMQVAPKMYRHEADAFATIFREEGIRGLYKGLSMNWIKGPIAMGISFAVNDFLKDMFSTL